MVIREDRDRLIEIINEYLHEKITAFEFDDKLWQLGDSKDETVVQVRKCLWYYYDDIQDHKVVASKQDWDYFQRILLLLQTNSEFEKMSWRWHSSELIALLLFCISISIFIFTKNIYVGICFNVIFWPFSYLIAKSRLAYKSINLHPFQEKARFFPYKSFKQLLSHRRAIPCFKKKQYPSELNKRTIRGKFLEMNVAFIWYIIWVVFCPVVLLFQIMPISPSPLSFQVNNKEYK